jgi:hypothetical protein
MRLDPLYLCCTAHALRSRAAAPASSCGRDVLRGRRSCDLCGGMNVSSGLSTMFLRLKVKEEVTVVAPG